MHAAAVPASMPGCGDELTPEDLVVLLRRPAWQADGACHEHPEVSWFPARGQSDAPARRVCATCLVRAECAAWAAAQGPDLQGVWGGLTAKDRRQGLTAPRPAPSPRRMAQGPQSDSEQLDRLAVQFYPEAVALLASLG